MKDDKVHYGNIKWNRLERNQSRTLEITIDKGSVAMIT